MLDEIKIERFLQLNLDSIDNPYTPQSDFSTAV